MRTSFSKRTLSSAWASAKRIFSATGVCRHSAALRGDSNQRGLEADLARSRARTAPRRDAAARMTMPNDPRPSSTPSFSVSLLTFQSFISRSFIAAPVQLRLHRRRHAGPHLGEPCAFLSGSQEGLEAINARAPAAGPAFSARAENEAHPQSTEPRGSDQNPRHHFKVQCKMLAGLRRRRVHSITGRWSTLSGSRVPASFWFAVRGNGSPGVHHGRRRRHACRPRIQPEPGGRPGNVAAVVARRRSSRSVRRFSEGVGPKGRRKAPQGSSRRELPSH